MITITALRALPELAVEVTARIHALSADDTRIALLVILDSIIATERHCLGAKAPGLGAEHLGDRVPAAGREEVVILFVALVRVGVHDKIAADAGRGRALGLERIVLGTPVVAELVRGDQLGLALQQTTLLERGALERTQARVNTEELGASARASTR